MLINRSGAMVIPFLTIYLNVELEIPLGRCALIMSCFGAGSVIGSFLGGVLTDRIGFFKVMYRSLIGASFLFVLLMQMKTFATLCIFIFILAIVYELFRPANLTAIEAFSKPENLTRSLGLVRLAVNLGYGIGPFMGGFVAAYLGYDFLFIFNGLAILLGGICFYNMFKNKKHRTTSVEITEKEKAELIMPWNDGSYLLYLLFFTLTIIVFMQILYSAPLYFKTEFGFDESLVGFIMGCNGIIIAIFEMPMLYVLEEKFRPVIYVFIGSMSIGIGFFVFNLVGAPILAAILYTLFLTFGEMLSFPFSNNYAMSFSKDHNRGKYMGLYTMTFSTAHVVAPLLGLQIVNYLGYSALWNWSACLCIFAAICILLTRKKANPVIS